MTSRRALALTVVFLAAALTASSAVLTITPNSLQPPNTIPINVAYSQGLTAAPTPGQACVWTISAGGLPPGLKIGPVAGNNGAGTISGTPTQSGQFTFTANCTAGVDSGSRQYTLYVSPLVLTITPASLQPPQTIPLNADYSVGLTASPPSNSPCVWSISSGALPPGLAISGVAGNPTAGTISGVPTQGGNFTFTATCIAGPDQGSRAYTLFVLTPLSITQTSIPGGAQNTAYSASLSATGGLPPYTWSFGPGTNSDGLGLCPQDGALVCPTGSGGGALFGTPGSAGTFTLNIVVRDSAGQQATVPLSLVVTAGVTIQTSSLAPGAVGASYSQTLAGSGGKTPYAWSVTSGSLPAGLTLDPATGIISGTPTAGGTAQFSVTLTDATPVTATASLSINVLGITTTSLPDGTVGTAYSQTLTTVGGGPPLTWAVSAGTLPAGLTLNASTGTISGTPTTAGSSTFTISATYTPVSVAAVPPPVTTQQQFTVVIAGTMTVTPSNLPPIVQGTAFSQVLGTVIGGVAPYTWAIVTGTLPTGLRFDPATGIVSGTTTTAQAGNFPITFTVTDSSPKPLVARANVTFTVSAPPPFTSATITVPGTSGSVQQQQALVSISGPYPLPITGTLTLTFASSVGGDDQMVQFTSGTCTVTGSSHTCTTPFTIPVGATQASFGGAATARVLTGTVAGTITVTAKLTDSALNDVTPNPPPTSTIVINATVPVISSVKITTPAPGQFNVVVTGFSSTRDMVSGLFHFAPTTGTTLSAPDITVQLGSAFTTWYSTPSSNVFGSQFTMTVPFTYQANAIPFTAVTVTLTNSKGASNPSSPANP